MSVTFTFCYDAEDKSQFEVEEVSIDGIGLLLEIHLDSSDEDYETTKRSWIYPSFVQHFSEPAASIEMSAEEWDIDAMGDYVGPSFSASELSEWVEGWMKTIPLLAEQERITFGLQTESGFDSTAYMLKDLAELLEQARCAERHGVTLHIEMC